MDEKDEDLLASVIDRLASAYEDSINPPPHFAEAVDSAASEPTGVTKEQIEVLRRRSISKLSEGKAAGNLLRMYREALTLDLEDVARKARWNPDDLEKLEQGQLDLQSVEAERIALLLFALGLESLGALEQPLREILKLQMERYESAPTAVYGRTRRDVTSVQRRRDLLKGIAVVDQEATLRAADIYLRRISDEMTDLWASRKS